jgi:hypothetical protein
MLYLEFKEHLNFSTRKKCVKCAFYIKSYTGFLIAHMRTTRLTNFTRLCF